MKILVTGSSGFIGFHFSKLLLEKGHQVHGIDSMNSYYDVKLKKARLNILTKYKKFSFTKINLQNDRKIKNIFKKFRPKIVVHLAAQAGVRYSIHEPRVYLSSNIDGTFNVIEAAHKIKVKHLIMASSSSVYGGNKKLPFKEIDKTESQLSIYAATKKANESMAHSYSNIWKIPITMLRFFTVYGPWGRPDMALFKFTKGIINGKSIDVYNKGKMFRDFTYIDDVVKGIYLLLNKIPNKKQFGKYKYDSLSNVAPFRILNIGNKKKILLLDFLKEIEIRLSKKANKNFKPLQKGDVKRTLSNIDLLKSITGYNPKTNYKEGINKFVKWYKNYYKKN
ncbi:NAD-dependent epimerase/dehydratase family protein [Candidatus Pelagibacter communis]|uniref:NAD-dependent epimerase/dehydratase family protein n=1 Tax=Pelagibacter ubique TaxID=198252 RepID=UPI00094C5D41|nr:NAD-dependent epimerase/dehydratase family protein [Candidatus Pelagibacter ubique]